MSPINTPPNKSALASGAVAGQYEFLAAPQINLSLVYRLDKLSGDVIACQFAHNPGRADVGPGAFGVTSCYRSGDGATKQDPSDYGLIATRHEQEGGVFRVDYRTGERYVSYESVKGGFGARPVTLELQRRMAPPASMPTAIAATSARSASSARRGG